MNTNNLLLNTDSYKASHWLQYPPGTQYVSSYIESRGGKWDETLFFGLQAFMKEYLSTPITQEDVDEAAEFWEAHGEPFNREGWEYIVKEHGGKLPIEIQAVPEGTIMPTKNVLVQVVNTDPKCFWLVSYLETALLRAVWYPTTVATNSLQAKRVIKRHLEATSDLPIEETINFKMHDFGARGVSSFESAGLGGAAHLINFMGTDTVTGILFAKKYYGADMAGFSIPASEHSTMTSWGGEPGEIDAMENMIKQFAGPGKLFACVSDSFDIFKAAKEKWPSLDKLLQEKGGTLVVRPDSGDPVYTPVQVVNSLLDAFGYTTNSKGYKVLPDRIRVIQGDGITAKTIDEILTLAAKCNISADNFAFGQGGGLLQQVNRDTLKFAMKASAIQIDGKWRDVYKSPIGQEDKKSKRGRLALVWNASTKLPETVREYVEDERKGRYNILQVVYRNGEITRRTGFDDIRRLAKI